MIAWWTDKVKSSNTFTQWMNANTAVLICYRIVVLTATLGILK
jgi:hypothetical protein